MCPDCGHSYYIGMWPFPCGGRGHELGSFWSGDSAIHTSEKTVIYENPRTGDIKIPGRGDRPLHPKLAAEGYQRRTLDTITQVRELERKKNVISERLNYNLHSTQAERDTGSQ